MKMAGSSSQSIVDGRILMDEAEKAPDLDVVIVGAGLSGLAIALALQQRNFPHLQYQVFESHPHLRSDTSTAIGIGRNGITALEGIRPGLPALLAQEGTYTSSMKAINIVNGREDEPRITLVAPNEYICVRWQSVQQILAASIDSAKLCFSHKLVAYKPCQGGVEAYFRHRCGDSENRNSTDKIKVIRTKLLIGADGIWSSVRKQMVGDSPRYLKMVDWNALLYNPDLKIFDGIQKGEIVAQSEGNLQTLSMIVHAGDYTLWILRKRDESGDLANSLLAGKGGLGIPGCKGRALQQLDGLEGWDVLRAAINATSEDIISERKIMDRLPLNKWSDADGHVLLIGDAAHAQYVGPGQGAGTAFEDAHQLSILLETTCQESLSEEEGIEKAVKRFEELRIPRLNKMQQYAANSTRIPDFQPEWVQKLTLEERLRMRQEYMKWVYAYPHKQQRDAESVYFNL